MMTGYYYVDIGNITETGQFYERLEQALPLPDWFGRNLDALYDVLTECGEGWRIEILGMDAAGEALPEFISRLRRMLQDAMECTEGLEILY